VRVKASIRDFTAETNLTVITEEGGFYTFDAVYAENPTTSTLEIATLNHAATESGPTPAADGRVLLQGSGARSPRR